MCQGRGPASRASDIVVQSQSPSDPRLPHLWTGVAHSLWLAGWRECNGRLQGKERDKLLGAVHEGSLGSSSPLLLQRPPFGILSHNLLPSKAYSGEHRDGAATWLKAQPGPSVQVTCPSSEDLVERTPEF